MALGDRVSGLTAARNLRYEFQEKSRKDPQLFEALKV